MKAYTHVEEIARGVATKRIHRVLAGSEKEIVRSKLGDAYTPFLVQFAALRQYAAMQ